MTGDTRSASAAIPASAAAIESGSEPFHVMTIGWEIGTITHFADPIQAETGFKFSHVPDPSRQKEEFKAWARSSLYFLREGKRGELPPPDRSLLASLEQPGVPTVHNMIMGDRVVCHLPYADALAYVSDLAVRLEDIFRSARPSLILGGFDSVHNGVAMAVARKTGIPWFAISFTAVPTGFAGFCSEMSPGSSRSYLPASTDARRTLAELVLSDFTARRMVVPAYLSANSLSMIARRFPQHLAVFARAVFRTMTGRFDRFTQYTVKRLARDYVRRRRNLFLLRRQSFVSEPPATPYLFFGLHMQPESSIDVWAPFFADQFAVVEAIARSAPPSHDVLIKLHKSDADNYSPSELGRLTRLPGVRLVSPHANSRRFIEQASLVFAIQGSMAMEAALAGRPVLLFGDSRFVDLAGVCKVKRITDLPDQIRKKLSEETPDRESIIRGLMAYFRWYAPGCYNDWDVTLSDGEVKAFAEHLRALRDHIQSESAALQRS
jgi:hypothetical protein